MAVDSYLFPGEAAGIFLRNFRELKATFEAIVLNLSVADHSRYKTFCYQSNVSNRYFIDFCKFCTVFWATCHIKSHLKLLAGIEF